VPLYELKAGRETSLVYSAGLEPAARRLLADAGYRVRVKGWQPARLQEPDWDRLSRLGGVDHALMVMVRRHEQALVRYGPTVDPTRLVAQLALAWPEKKMAVVVRRLDEGKQVRDHLRHHGLDVALVSGKHPAADNCQVTVTTPAGLAYTPTDVEWLDVVIVLDAVEATNKECLECVSHAWRARLYGLLPVGVKPAPLEQDMMRCLFGFERSASRGTATVSGRCRSFATRSRAGSSCRRSWGWSS
jgi:hypothetical protein